MIVELKAGGTATLRERLTYAQARAIRAALLAVDADRANLADLDLVLVREYVSHWSVQDLAGEAVPLEHPELAPDDVIQEITQRAMDHWKGTAGKLPKDGNGASVNMLQALPSESRIPTSEPSSSLTDTPAGVGPI